MESLGGPMKDIVARAQESVTESKWNELIKLFRNQAERRN